MSLSQIPSCFCHDHSPGYVLMSEFPVEDDGRHAVVLKLSGEASQNATVEYIQAGSAGDFPKVTVTYDEALATTEVDETTGADVVVAVEATIQDSWEGGDFYSGAPTTQILCEDSTSPDKEANNLCFRSDVVVSSFESNGKNQTVIESSGCVSSVIAAPVL